MVKFRRFRDKTSCSAWAETLWRKRMNFQSILKSDRNTKHVSSFRIWEKQRLHILNNVLGDVSLSPHSMKPPKLPWHFLLFFCFEQKAEYSESQDLILRWQASQAESFVPEPSSEIANATELNYEHANVAAFLPDFL